MDVLSAVVGVGVGVGVGFVVGIIVGKSGSAKPAAKAGPGKPANRAPKKPSGDGIELYVGNLSYDVDDAMLKAEFDSYGTVVSARVIKNKYNNRSRGYGFVEMSNEKEANKAVKATHGKEVLGRKLVVNIARSSSRD